MDHKNFTYEKYQEIMQDHCLHCWSLTNKKTGSSVSFNGIGYFDDDNDGNTYGFKANGLTFEDCNNVKSGIQEGISRWAMEFLKDVNCYGSEDWVIWEKLNEAYEFVFVKYARDKEEIK